MILLTGTNETLEVTTSTTQATDVVASYVDITTTTFTPGSAQATISSITQTPIVSAPAASTQRQIKFVSVRNRGTTVQTTALIKKVGGTSYALTPVVTLYAGETLIYISDEGFSVLDAVGMTKRNQEDVVGFSSVLVSPNFCPINLAGTFAPGFAVSCAQYMGKAPRDLTSVVARMRVTTNGAGITWAEAALAVGRYQLAAPSTLTIVGTTNAAAIFNSTGLKSITINVAASQRVRRDDDLWLIVGCNVSMAFRSVGVAASSGLSLGQDISRAATQPSTVVGQVLDGWALQTANESPWLALVV